MISGHHISILYREIFLNRLNIVLELESCAMDTGDTVGLHKEDDADHFDVSVDFDTDEKKDDPVGTDDWDQKKMRVTSSGRDITVSSAASRRREIAVYIVKQAKDKSIECKERRLVAEEELRLMRIEAFEKTRAAADEVNNAESQVAEFERSLELARTRLEEANTAKSIVAKKYPEFVSTLVSALDVRVKDEEEAIEALQKAQENEEEAIYELCQAAATEVAAEQIREENKRLKEAEDFEKWEEQCAEDRENMYVFIIHFEFLSFLL